MRVKIETIADGQPEEVVIYCRRIHAKKSMGHGCTIPF